MWTRLVFVALGVGLSMPAGCPLERPATVAKSPAAGSDAGIQADVLGVEARAAAREAEADLSAARAAIDEGRYHEAIRRAWSAAVADRSNVEARVVLAGAYQLADRHDDALREADAIIGIEPRTVGAWLTRGVALHALGRPLAAIRAAEQAIHLDADNLAAYENLLSFTAAARDTERHAAALERLVELRPDALRYRLLLARNRLAVGDLGRAHAQARAAFDRDASSAEAHLLLALVAFERSEHLEAMDHADLAFRLDPEGFDAQQLFRAAFYVQAAATLTCRHGERPWTNEQIEAVLEGFRREGITGAENFHAIEAEYGDKADANRRIERAARNCDGKMGR